MIKKCVAGIIAFQGSVEEHVKSFERLGVLIKKVNNKKDLTLVTHLVIPGGESTVIGKFLLHSGLKESIKEKYQKKELRIWGTCAGAILLGKGASEYSLNLMDVKIERNAYGTQIDSFSKKIYFKELQKEIETIFIRAPIISAVGEGVTILAQDGNVPILCKENSILISTFHPELTEDLSIQKYFLEKI